MLRTRDGSASVALNHVSLFVVVCVWILGIALSDFLHAVNPLVGIICETANVKSFEGVQVCEALRSVV